MCLFETDRTSLRVTRICLFTFLDHRDGFLRDQILSIKCNLQVCFREHRLQERTYVTNIVRNVSCCGRKGVEATYTTYSLEITVRDRTFVSNTFINVVGYAISFDPMRSKAEDGNEVAHSCHETEFLFILYCTTAWKCIFRTYGVFFYSS